MVETNQLPYTVYAVNVGYSFAARLEGRIHDGGEWGARREMWSDLMLSWPPPSRSTEHEGNGDRAVLWSD